MDCIMQYTLIDGLMQKRRHSFADTLELSIICIKPAISEYNHLTNYDFSLLLVS